MAAAPEQSRERASEEATEWLIQLQEAPDDEDLRRRFDAWRAASGDNAAAWAMMQRVSALIAATPAAQGAVRIRKVRRPSRPRRMGLRIAGLALAACLIIAILPSLLLRAQADYLTGTAQLRTLQLVDGSTVVLAPDSAIAVAYRDGERRVRLLAGEAFFEVAPNAARPFRVSARNVDAIVLGTRFDVRLGDDGAAVSVQHGLVRVDHAGASPPVSETLGAGQSVRVSWAGQALRGSEPPDLVAAWRLGQLIAQDQPMGEIVDQLRRYYSGRIIVASGSLAERRVTGAYNLTDPVDALRGIARAHGATVRQVTPWLLIVSDS
jgi:transmembrane sensor